MHRGGVHAASAAACARRRRRGCAARLCRGDRGGARGRIALRPDKEQGSPARRARRLCDRRPGVDHHIAVRRDPVLRIRHDRQRVRRRVRDDIRLLHHRRHDHRRCRGCAPGDTALAQHHQLDRRHGRAGFPACDSAGRARGRLDVPAARGVPRPHGVKARAAHAEVGKAFV